mgnify:CR=1 FL=1
MSNKVQKKFDKLEFIEHLLIIYTIFKNQKTKSHSLLTVAFLELLSRFELPTSSLPIKVLTANFPLFYCNYKNCDIDFDIDSSNFFKIMLFLQHIQYVRAVCNFRLNCFYLSIHESLLMLIWHQ